MTAREIGAFIKKQQKISDRNFKNYQETGIKRYLRTHENAEEMIDMAGQALKAADDHQMVGVYNADIGRWGEKAAELLYKKSECDPEVERLLRDIKSAAVMRGLLRDVWK